MVKQTFWGRLLHGLRREQGSFTLEATLVFPLLLGLILLFILFGMYMYQKVVLYYAASSTVERAAFSWDNSYRTARSGMLNEPVYDGLYWRVGENDMLGSLFGMAGDHVSSTILLPLEDQDGAGGSDLSERKLLQSAKWIGAASLAYQGQINYARSVLKKEVEVKLKSPFANGAAEKSWLRREAKTVSSATIVDPTEFIRSVDLARYYATKFANRTGGARLAREEAGQVLAPYTEHAKTREQKKK
ncbi:TadE/TadG family type IV pilus assembly protein [Paenibacillus sinopodophylli]|uniref:TadE/TadG family type IV pilus assembly protein n=1 Tax=Paenibacillus sinopodophylli TaxID=1837342 RepID=UPI00110C9D9C|nr:TadE/TadG family type IV pilus assembly protein [Paenibacillus sinopodophylli]